MRLATRHIFLLTAFAALPLCRATRAGLRLLLRHYSSIATMKDE
jgi:hypothetical protein